MYIRNLLEAQYGPASRWLQETSLKPIVGCKFGLELEVEGSSIPRAHTILPYWQTITDGSLRALPEALEYKTLPLSIEGIRKALDVFGASSKSSTFKPSIRTSTHLHINVQDMNLTQVANFIAIYLLLEGSLYEICGKHRRGNVFCIPLTQCDDILRRFGKLCKQQHHSNLRNLSGDGDKYAALSLRSMYYYGTLEVRTHEGVSEKELERVYNWTSIFKSIRDYALRGDVDPVYVLQTASNMGPEEFTKMFLGEDFNMVDTQSFWDGVSSIQYFATSSDWKPEEPLNLKETPDIEPKKASKKKSPAVNEDLSHLSHEIQTTRFLLDDSVGIVRGLRRGFDRASNSDVMNTLYDRNDTRALYFVKRNTANHFGILPSEVSLSHMDQYLTGNRINIAAVLSDYDVGKYVQRSDGSRLQYMGIQLALNEDMPVNPPPDEGLFNPLQGTTVRAAPPVENGTGRSGRTGRTTIGNTGTIPVSTATISTSQWPNVTITPRQPADDDSLRQAEEAIRRIRARQADENANRFLASLDEANNRIRVQATADEIERELRDLDNHDDGED